MNRFRKSFRYSEVSCQNVLTEYQRVESLLSVAEDLLQNCKPEERGRLANAILPSRECWESALDPFLQLPPRVSTAISSTLGGTLFLVDRDVPDSLQKELEGAPRDVSQLSSAFRLALFSIKILASSLFSVGQLGADESEILLYYLPLAVQLIDDDLSIKNCNGIIGPMASEQRDEYTEDVIEGYKIINSWANSPTLVDAKGAATVSSVLCSVWENKLQQLKDVFPVDYRLGQSFVKIMTEVRGMSLSKDVTKVCREARTANAIQSAAWIAVLRESIVSNPVGIRLCNELVADLTGLKPEDERKDG